MKAVNKVLLELYWEIGEEINNQQSKKDGANPLLRFWQMNFD